MVRPNRLFKSLLVVKEPKCQYAEFNFGVRKDPINQAIVYFCGIITLTQQIKRTEEDNWKESNLPIKLHPPSQLRFILKIQPLFYRQKKRDNYYLCFSGFSLQVSLAQMNISGSDIFRDSYSTTYCFWGTSKGNHFRPWNSHSFQQMKLLYLLESEVEKLAHWPWHCDASPSGAASCSQFCKEGSHH